jgi:hypothetical protein
LFDTEVGESNSLGQEKREINGYGNTVDRTQLAKCEYRFLGRVGLPFNFRRTDPVGWPRTDANSAKHALPKLDT